MRTWWILQCVCAKCARNTYNCTKVSQGTVASFSLLVDVLQTDWASFSKCPVYRYPEEWDSVKSRFGIYIFDRRKKREKTERARMQLRRFRGDERSTATWSLSKSDTSILEIYRSEIDCTQARRVIWTRKSNEWIDWFLMYEIFRVIT